MNKNYTINLQAKLDDSASTIAALNKQINTLEERIGKIDIKANMNTNAIKNAKSDFNTLDSAAKNSQKQANKWQYSWSKAFQSFTTYMSVTTVFYQTINTIKDMVNEVIELDSALVELQKVTDLSGDSLKQFTEDAYDAASAVAKTGTEMIEAATEFAKAGYDESQVLKLGELALMYTNIADETVSAAEASEFMIAQMKAFNIEADEAIHIIDAVNEVANNFAVSSADIANNLGKSSAVMANAGNSYEQMIGLLTAGTEITRNASKVSNGLKTITLRLQGMDDEGTESLELVAQMENLFNKLSLSVYKSNGDLKNTYEILQELAPVYQEATAAEKAYITETIAGKYQAQNAAAILNNFQTALEATETALNSEGSAMEENAKVIDSIQGKINSFKSAFEELANTFISSGFIKGVVDFGTILLNVANSGFGQWIIKGGLLSLTLIGLTNGVSKIISTFGKLKIILSTSGNVLKLFTTNISLLTKRNQLLALSQNAETQSLKKTKIQMASLGISTVGVTTKKKAQIAVNTALTASQTALNFAISAGTMLLTGAVALFQSYSQAQEEAKEKAAELEEELRSNAIESGDELSQRNASLDGYIDKYKDLKAELDSEQTGYKRSIELRNEILSLQKDINTLLGDENNGIDLINDSLEETIKNQNEIKKNSAEDYMAENASAIKKAQDNLSKNYYSSTDNKRIATDERHWYENMNKETDEWLEKYDAMLQAVANATGKNVFWTSGWGGKNDDHTGFDKFSFIELDMDMNAQEALEMWKNTYEELRENKEKYITEYGLTDADYDEIVETSNKNYTKVKNYIEKQQEVLNKAAESMVYSDENHSSKIGKLNIAGAKYNLAVAEGDDDAKAAAIKEIADVQSYVDGLTDDAVKNYFQDILDKWQTDINQSQVQSTLSTYFNSLGNDLKNKLLNLGIDGDTFKQMMENYQNGITDGLDADTIKLLAKFKKVMDDGGYSVESFTSFLENLGYVFPGVKKQTNNAVEALSTLDTQIEELNKNIDSIQNAFQTMHSAMEEYNNNGYLTIDTMQQLLALDDRYLQHLIDENGQLQLNTNAFLRLAHAQLDEAEAAAITEAINDMAILTAQSEQAEIDKLRIKYSGLSTELGNVADRYNEVTISAATLKETEGISQEDKDLADDIVKTMEAKLAIVKAARAGLGTNFTDAMGGSSGSSSSSSSAKEWWEVELEKLKEQFKYNEITIEEYIKGLDNLLGRVNKGTDAWKKINEEFQKQRLTKVEDDYKRGTISLDEYIARLKELIKAYKQGTDAWNELADKIKKGLQDKADAQKDDLDTAEDAAVGLIEEEIDRINELRDAEEERYDALIEAKEKANEETEKELELARLQEALENARNEKTKRVWREGIGKKSADVKDNYIGQMLEIVKTEVRLNLRWCVYG